MSEKIKVNKSKGFTVLQNGILKDERLTYKAIGIYAVIMSLPPNWNLTVSGLVKIKKGGRTIVMSGINELEQFGYMSKEKTRDSKGHFKGYDYEFYDIPKERKPTTEKPTTEKPTTEKPNTVKPTTGKQQQLSTKELSTKELSTKELSTKELSTKELKTPTPLKGGTQKNEYSDNPEFNYLWEAYPKHGRKKEAYNVFEKLKADDALLFLILESIEKWKKSIDWLKANGQYIPNLNNFLKNRRYLDEPKAPLNASLTSSNVMDAETENALDTLYKSIR